MSRIYYINSRNRTSGADGDFTHEIKLSDLGATHAVVLQAYIPKSYYLVAEGANIFQLEEKEEKSNVEIDPGSYSRSSFRSQLQTKLNQASPNGWLYTVSVPATAAAETGKFTFSVANNDAQPSFIVGSDLWEQLGFGKDTINTFEDGDLTSTAVVNLQSEQTLFLHSDLIQDTDSVLQEIYSSNSLNFSGISFQNPCPDLYAKKISTSTSNTYRFYLADENSNPINLNGLNIVFTLLVYTPINWRAAISSIIDNIP